MSIDETGRKAHIKRIFKDNDTQSDTWVDVERIEELNVVIAGRQTVRYKFDWDNTSSFDKKTLTDPHDQENKIDIPIRKSVRLEGPNGVRNHYFLNTDSNKSRQTHSRRVYHHEIKQDYLEAENQPPKEPERYKDSLGRQDKDVFIDVELLDAYWMAGDTISDVHGHAGRAFRGRTDGSSSVRGQNRKWLGTVDDELLKEPMVQSDEPGGAPPFEPITNPERGQIDPPWRLDPLQNIVNVSWGKNVIFLTGDLTANIALIAGKSGDEPQIVSLGHLDFGANGSCYGSSFQIIADDPTDPGQQSGSVFLLCGEVEQIGTGNDSIIMASKNTETWQTVYRLQQIPSSAFQRGRTSIMGVVWDAAENKFFAGAHQANEYFVMVPTLGMRLARQEDIDILLSSKDGWAWREDSRATWNVNFNIEGKPDKGPPPWTAGLLVPHCRTVVKDDNGNGVPDGIYYYKVDEETGQSLLVRPDRVPTIRYNVGGVNVEPGSQIGIEETSPTGEVTITILEPPIPVSAVGYAGGVITAVGGSTASAAFAMTMDRGQTEWKMGSYGSYYATTVVGARITKEG